MDMNTLILWAVVAIILSSLALIADWVIRNFVTNPYHYPYKIIQIDISRKRNVQFEDALDRYLCEHSLEMFRDHVQYVRRWKRETEASVAKSWFKKKRRKQYHAALDDQHMFVFRLTREQTRYQQQNYVRYAYVVDMAADEMALSFRDIMERYEQLAAIDFQCTLREYHDKNQRKNMTKELKEKIKKRYNYTCQICGKYMPDEVGLHIDHIVPVSKGGKSVESNLQVLCSKCNGRKSNK